MKTKITYILLIAISLFIFTGCKRQENINKSTKIENNNKSSEVVNSMKIMINDKEYIINLENNETTRSLINLLPLEIDMNELNGNEKYFYLKTSLPTNAISPKHINVGDVMLYGNNCLVIFYNSFDTSYSYTRIGHIDNLPNLGNSNISVKISIF